MKPINYSVFLLAFFLFCTTAFAQVNDANLWFSLNAEKKINPKLSVTLAEEFRFNENVTELGSLFSDLGVQYKFSKYLRASVNYRFIHKKKLDDTYNFRNRFYFDLTGKFKFSSIVLQHRVRMQTQYNQAYNDIEDVGPYYYMRNKTTIKLDLDKNYTPYIFGEIYTPLIQGESLQNDKVKMCAGVEYKINRAHEIDLFYSVEKELLAKNPITDFIIGLAYNFTF